VPVLWFTVRENDLPAKVEVCQGDIRGCGSKHPIPEGAIIPMAEDMSTVHEGELYRVGGDKLHPRGGLGPPEHPLGLVHIATCCGFDHELDGIGALM
jgi:hypothetical protein